MTSKSKYFDTVTFTFTDPETPTTPVDVACEVRSAVVEPDTPVDTRRTLSGPTKAVGVPDWTLSIEYDQAWDTAGISTFLADHVGDTMTFLLEWTEGASQATGDVLIVPGPWGGTAGEVAEGTVDLPVVGQPTFSTFTPAAAAAAAGKRKAPVPA